jgi:hypothetical protein
MAGRGVAVHNGGELQAAVKAVAEGLGLKVTTEVRVARRLWGAERFIDVVATDVHSRRSLGIECKYQGGSGSAEEKIPSTILDIDAWPIPGIVVFSGDGFSSNMRSYLYSTGKAVAFEDLESWLQLFFGLPSPPAA